MQTPTETDVLMEICHLPGKTTLAKRVTAEGITRNIMEESEARAAPRVERLPPPPAAC